VRAVCQRVRWARVLVESEVVGAIEAGWAILLGVGVADDEATAGELARQIIELRTFDDGSGRMNLAAADVNAQFLVISQITLHADTSRGRRPSFVGAAPRELAIRLVDYFVEQIRAAGFTVATGRFGAMMQVELCNDGPVTIVLSTDGWT
jgi:D-aminoacyl-tRNA deacylase